MHNTKSDIYIYVYTGQEIIPDNQIFPHLIKTPNEIQLNYKCVCVCIYIYMYIYIFLISVRAQQYFWYI